MVCKGCGAELMETDLFCPKCGAKVIKEMRCKECGAVLREGTKFCHKCGRLVDGGRQGAASEIEDMAIDVIEQNILSETAAELKAGNRPAQEASAGRTQRSQTERTQKSSTSRSASAHGSAPKSASQKSAPAHGSTTKRTASKSASGRSTPVKAAPGKRPAQPSGERRRPEPEPPRRKQPRYREDDWEEEDWEDEDDWDEEDDEGMDAITIMTIVAGCVLLIVVAVLGYHLYRQYAPKSYEKEVQSQEETSEAEENGTEEELPEENEAAEQSVPERDESGTYQIIVIHNVNVRDQPSTSGTNVLMVAQEGDVYTCYGSTADGEWYEIRLEDGTPGYVFHEYVTVDEGGAGEQDISAP